MKKSWFREPFVWLVILFPASAVMGGIVTITLAVHSNDGLVSDDYYKQGLEINRILERDQAAARYGLEAILRFNVEHQLIRLTLNAKADYSLPHQIQLNLSHHTRSGLDKSVNLVYLGNNTYQSVLPKLEEGFFFIQLAADDWRLLDSTQLPITQTLEIKAMI
jgi:uncharacterized protein